MPSEVTRRTTLVTVNDARAPGRYWVHLYFGDQKIAEATFEAAFPTETHSIRGVASGPDGKRVGRMELSANRSGERSGIEAGPDGSFDLVVPPGSFIVEVFLLLENGRYEFMGWYDGKDGTTIDPDKTFTVVVEDSDVTGLSIRLPEDYESLICTSSGLGRSYITGQCR